jgi:hypothetical protein
LNQDIENTGIAWAIDLMRTSFRADENICSSNPSLDYLPYLVLQIFECTVKGPSYIRKHAKIFLVQRFIWNFKDALYSVSRALWATFAATVVFHFITAVTSLLPLL